MRELLGDGTELSVWDWLLPWRALKMIRKHSAASVGYKVDAQFQKALATRLGEQVCELNLVNAESRRDKSKDYEVADHMSTKPLTVGTICGAIRYFLEEEAKKPTESAVLTLHGTPEDSVMKKIFTAKGGKVLIEINELPTDLRNGLLKASPTPQPETSGLFDGEAPIPRAPSNEELRKQYGINQPLGGVP